MNSVFSYSQARKKTYFCFSSPGTGRGVPGYLAHNMDFIRTPAVPISYLDRINTLT